MVQPLSQYITGAGGTEGENQLKSVLRGCVRAWVVVRRGAVRTYLEEGRQPVDAV